MNPDRTINGNNDGIRSFDEYSSPLTIPFDEAEENTSMHNIIHITIPDKITDLDFPQIQAFISSPCKIYACCDFYIWKSINFNEEASK